MPAAPRKSTGTARNSKKHIPYRHDDLQHGKRTGMAVDVVDRNSDDFEPFDKLLSQADTRTPPRVKGKRKSLVPSPVYEDEDGEMSMDIASPLSYFNSQRARVPESFINTGPPARSFYMSPEADFDEVPSPRVSVAAISASRRRSSVKFTARASRLGGSPGLPPGDSDEDLEDGFEPPPTFEHRSRYTPLSPSPDRASFPRKSKGHDKPLFLPDPDSEDEQPEPSTSKRTNRRKSSKASVALVGLEQDGEEEEVEEDHPEDVEMDLDRPDEEDFNSRRSRKLSSIVEAEEEEEDEPEPMDFEQDAGPEELPEDQPDEPPEEPDDPPPAKPPKKRGNKKISFDENSVGVKRPSKKPRSNRTPLADRTSDSRYVSIRPGEPRQRPCPPNLSSERTLFWLVACSQRVPREPTGITKGSEVPIQTLGLVASRKGRLWRQPRRGLSGQWRRGRGGQTRSPRCSNQGHPPSPTGSRRAAWEESQEKARQERHG